MELAAIRAARLGQSIWYDNISRDLLISGEVARLIREDGVRGMTSNPSIFQKAMTTSSAYAEQFGGLAAAGLDASGVYEAMAIQDIQAAADALRGIYDESEGEDGYISLEVSPLIAADTEATVVEARRLWAAVDRKNLMIKVPATSEGIPAVRTLIGDGINVNVTLIFSLAGHAAVIEAYVAGLEDRHERGDAVTGISSVASFFVSRVDSAVDKALGEIGSETATGLQGKAAVANAKCAYAMFEKRFGGERWAKLAAAGARVQRPLWASTSTKNPSYPDTLYVDSLIGPHTVNTIPPKTLVAFNDHGEVELTIGEGLDQARADLRAIEAQGVSLDGVCDTLLAQGVASFAKAFEELLAAVETRRVELAGKEVPADAGSFRFAAASDTVAAARERLATRRVLPRLLDADATVWGEDPAVLEVCRNRLGWLAAVQSMRQHVAGLAAFAKRVKDDGIRHVVLCGMGGSSLGSEVFVRVFGSAEGYPTMHVLDSTDPSAVARVDTSVALDSTLFLIASKSGSTLETDCLRRHFEERVRGAGLRDGTRHFVAITDPGSKLGDHGRSVGYRVVFENPADVGGRFSVLTLFGLVPAALLGIDCGKLLDAAERELHAAGPDTPPEQNDALQLGAALGALASEGRDRLSLRCSPSLASFGDWAEQLIAESTGKQGKGVLPLPAAAWPDAAVEDRLDLRIVLAGEEVRPAPAAVPQGCFDVADRHELGALFLRLELATAIAGAVLGVNPFDEPDVRSAKDATHAVLTGQAGEPQALPTCDQLIAVALPTEATAQEGGVVGEVAQARPAAALDAFLDLHDPADYLAILAFVHPTPESADLLRRLGRACADRTGAAVTVGFGPRYLHSTGQLHKGGPATGSFLVIQAALPESANDLEVPGCPFTFGTLLEAQARGDFGALASRGRRVALVRLARPTAPGLRALAAMLASAERTQLS